MIPATFGLNFPKVKNKIIQITKRAKEASHKLAGLSTSLKNRVLKGMARAILLHKNDIIRANARDIKLAKKQGLSTAMMDRLLLDDKRLATMAQGLRDVAALPDPVGQVVEHRKRNGLDIKRMRIPLGVIGMIYESRPNVTVDAAGLCFKSGNAVVLRGGSEAFHSNRVLVQILRSVLRRAKLNPDIISMIPQTDHRAMIEMLKMQNDIDVLIPRGGENLMRFISEHSKIPVIKHDKGVCSIFVDESAKLDEAIRIILNAKTQRPGVCNALESLYVHRKIAKKFLPELFSALSAGGVELRGDAASRQIIPQINRASKKDFGTEYLDLILSIKTVKDLDDAIANIRKYYSRHTESILTESWANAQKFVQALDSSCVMVNTSTRFNDGGELGLGAEIGISTSKLHAYGPMGLAELTTTHYVVESPYKVRN